MNYFRNGLVIIGDKNLLTQKGPLSKSVQVIVLINIHSLVIFWNATLTNGALNSTKDRFLYYSADFQETYVNEYTLLIINNDDKQDCTTLFPSCKLFNTTFRLEYHISLAFYI